MLMVLHGNDGVHTHNRGSNDILGATTHYTPVMTIKCGTALKSKTDYKLDLMARLESSPILYSHHGGVVCSST